MNLYGKEAGGYNFEVKFSLDHYYKKYKCTMILSYKKYIFRLYIFHSFLYNIG